MNNIDTEKIRILRAAEWSCHLLVDDRLSSLAPIIAKRVEEILERPICLRKGFKFRPQKKILPGNSHEFYQYFCLAAEGRETAEIVSRVSVAAPGRYQLFCADIITVTADVFRKAQTVALIITPEDLFSNDDDLYISGLSCFVNKVGIVSIRRLLDRFTWERDAFWFEYHDVDTLVASSDRETERITKAVAHEFLHLLGFVHCTNAACLMFGCSNRDALDRVSVRLCPEERERLRV